MESAGKFVNVEETLLDELLAYRNEDVIDSFCDSFDISREAAEDIFRETMRFMWLCHVSKDRQLRLIDKPLLIIDEMWHTFILFTRPYHKFCMRFFGEYKHHAPTTRAEKTQAEERIRKLGKQHVIDDKRERYGRIYERLGRDTFVKWFLEYPETYSPEVIRAMRLK